jgi:Na+-translocating ferredoxin:NAD+ oxidoreductase subunit G
MKKIIHYGAVLMIIAVISSGILAYFNKKTEIIIKEISKKMENQARKSVFENGKEFRESEKIEKSGIEYTPVYGKNSMIGYIAKVKSSGYGGNIVIITGINNNRKITGVKIIESRETPGLGDKILNEKWQKSWIGRDKNYKFNKEKDGFAGATISPRAVYSGLKKALENYPAKIEKKSQKTDIRVKLIEEGVKLREKEAIKTEECVFIPVYNKREEKIGVIAECRTNGYNGEIKFNMGISKEGKITGINITKSSETGGHGRIVEEKKWLDMWKGRDKNYKFNEETDAEVGATVSPRAVYKEINRVLSIYDKIKQ